MFYTEERQRGGSVICKTFLSKYIFLSVSLYNLTIETPLIVLTPHPYILLFILRNTPDSYFYYHEVPDSSYSLR